MDDRSMANRYALPDAWIDRIFARMEGLYGSLFLDRWKDCNLRNVKATWAMELAAYHANPHAISHALGMLTEKPLPPTLPEFLAMCRSAPRPERPALPAPEIDSDTMAERSVQMASKVGQVSRNDPLGWARAPRSNDAWRMVISASKDGMAPMIAILREHIAKGAVPSEMIDKAKTAVAA